MWSDVAEVAGVVLLFLTAYIVIGLTVEWWNDKNIFQYTEGTSTLVIQGLSRRKSDRWAREQGFDISSRKKLTEKEVFGD